MTGKIKFYHIAAVCASIATAILLLTPNINWEHSENWFFIYNCIDNYNANGFLTGLFDSCFDGWTPRPRVLSWLAFITNSQLRLWLFKYLPFHASFSLTWLLSVICMPILFYKSLRSLKVDKEGSVLGACLYLFTVGYLSTHLMYFHQAKPMAAFFLVLAFWWAMKYKVFNLKWAALLTLILYTGTQWDELFFFTMPFILVMHPLVFRDKKFTMVTLCSFAIATILFLITVTYLIPAAFKAFTVEKFNFWGYAFQGDAPTGLPKLENIFFNLKAMTFSHILPASNNWELGREPFWFLLAPVAFIAWSFKRLKDKSNLVRILLVIAGFTLFQSLILTRRSGVLFLGSFYWGHLFSIFFAYLVAIGLNKEEGAGRLFIHTRRAMFIILAIFCLQNALWFNRIHREENLQQVKSDYSAQTFQFPWSNLTNGQDTPLKWKHIFDVWNSRENFNEAKAKLKNVPDNGYWMYMHLYRMHHKFVRGADTVWGIERTDKTPHIDFSKYRDY